mmetsp:Transcript_12463/g.19291  ORF Transcript_12463/g.19291 Transcript_12463/m.19291 type:complete len:208 (-) Transcript_12463:109-732(-)
MNTFDVVVAPKQEGLTRLHKASAGDEQLFGETGTCLAGGVVNINNMKNFSNVSSSEETCASSKSEGSHVTDISALTVESASVKKISNHPQIQLPHGRNSFPGERKQNSNVRVWRSQRKLCSSQTIRSKKLSSYGSLRQLTKKYSIVSEGETEESPAKCTTAMTNEFPDKEKNYIAVQNKERNSSMEKFMELALLHPTPNFLQEMREI